MQNKLDTLKIADDKKITKELEPGCKLFFTF